MGTGLPRTMANSSVMLCSQVGNKLLLCFSCADSGSPQIASSSAPSASSRGKKSLSQRLVRRYRGAVLLC